jgi:hypothetical protein
MEKIVNGKKVQIRTKLPAKESWPLMGVMEQFGKGLANLTFEAVASLCAAGIESWEYEGNPREIASYESLDLFSEMMPLANAVIETVMGGAPSKN